MYPPAEDNYGTDACSILLLHTVPNVLAIATTTGHIYHSFLLPASMTQNRQVIFLNLFFRFVSPQSLH